MTKKTKTGSITPVKNTKSDAIIGAIGLVVLCCIGLTFCNGTPSYVCDKEVICPNTPQAMAGQLYRKVDTNEPVTGIVKGYYDNGQVQYEKNVENGKEGNSKAYYKDGGLMLEFKGKGFLINGEMKCYDENGRLKAVLHFKNGQMDGYQREYNEYGKLVDEAYYKNGQLQATGNFVDDELDGVQRGYYENGQLKAEEYYRNGKKENYKETHAVGKKLNVISLDGKGVNSDLEIKLFLNNLKDAPLDVIDRIILDNSDYVQYNRDGQHTIIQFFDHQCNWSKKLSLEMREALKTKGKNIRWITVDVPIWGKDSEQVSLYVLAAKEQGKYRELFKAMNEINPSEKMTEKTVLTEAKKLGLDIDKLKNDANSYELKEKIQKNRSFFKSLELRGVPTLIIDGKIYLNGALTKKQLDFVMNRLNK